MQALLTNSTLMLATEGTLRGNVSVQLGFLRGVFSSSKALEAIAGSCIQGFHAASSVFVPVGCWLGIVAQPTQPSAGCPTAGWGENQNQEEVQELTA